MIGSSFAKDLMDRAFGRVKPYLRRFLIDMLPMPLYWRIWSYRYGGRKAPLPDLAKSNHEYANLLQGSPANLMRLFDEASFTVDSEWPLAFEHNPSFETGDAETYSAVIRNFKPTKIIEVGVGYSSHIANASLKHVNSELLCLIDPDPRCPIPRSARLIRGRVQNVPVSLFESLNASDILFIDSSHTSDECQYHCEHILPRLAPGVLIHYHDVLYPFVPRHDEEEVILKHYLDHPSQYEVLFGLAYAWHTGVLNSILPEERVAAARVPSSFWTRKL